MQLEKILNEKLTYIDCEYNNKQDIFNDVAKRLYDNGFISQKDGFVEALFKRESEASTALESAVAIPHGKSSLVKTATVSFYRLKKAIVWDEDNTLVDTLFILSVPEEAKGSPHVELLSQIATLLMSANFIDQLKKINSFSQLIILINQSLENEKNTNSKPINVKDDSPLIVAVTACSTGIAHTYMAAEALNQAGQELGIRVHVEKQGASGIEDRLSSDIISKANAVLLATDVALQEADRFNDKKHLQVKVASAIKNSDAKALLQRLIANDNLSIYHAYSDNKTENKSENKSVGSQIFAAIMTGVSYMIPVLVAAGVIIGIAKLSAMQMGIINEIGSVEYLTHSNPIIALLAHMDKFGALIFRFLYPIFAMFVAFAIANRSGLVAGFLGGIFSSGLHYTMYGITGIPSGFMGAVILGLLAGYSAKFLNEKIVVPKNMQAIKPMFLVPALSVLIVFLANFYVVDPVMGSFNMWLQQAIMSMQKVGTLALASVIAGATAFDLGGPVNKAAGAIAIGLATDKVYPLTARVLAIVIPPIGLGLATVLDRWIVGRRVFSDELRIAGQTSLMLGFLAISEGALPFMFANPLLTIPINMLGAILGAVVAVGLNAVQWYPLPAIWGWPLVENLWAYLVGLSVGVLFIALANIFARFILLKWSKK